MKENHYLVPLQFQGFEKNLEYSIISDSVEDAEDDFVDAKERLLDVNNWNKYSENATIAFQLSDSNGKNAKRHARRGDHIRLEMASTTGATPDWVAIEAIEYDDYPDLGIETFAIRVRRSANPAQKRDEADMPHDTTATFVIERRGRKLFSSYHGRNESGMTTADIHADWQAIADEQWANLVKGFAGPMLVKR